MAGTAQGCTLFIESTCRSAADRHIASNIVPECGLALDDEHRLSMEAFREVKFSRSSYSVVFSTPFPLSQWHEIQSPLVAGHNAKRYFVGLHQIVLGHTQQLKLSLAYSSPRQARLYDVNH